VRKDRVTHHPGPRRGPLSSCDASPPALQAEVEAVVETFGGQQLPAWLVGALYVNGGGDYSGEACCCRRGSGQGAAAHLPMPAGCTAKCRDRGHVAFPPACAAGGALRHMFDGLALISKYRVEGGRVFGSQRFVNSEQYRAFKATGAAPGRAGSCYCWERGTRHPAPSIDSSYHVQSRRNGSARSALDLGVQLTLDWVSSFSGTGSHPPRPGPLPPAPGPCRQDPVCRVCNRARVGADACRHRARHDQCPDR